MTRFQTELVFRQSLYVPNYTHYSPIIQNIPSSKPDALLHIAHNTYWVTECTFCEITYSNSFHVNFSMWPYETITKNNGNKTQ